MRIANIATYVLERTKSTGSESIASAGSSGAWRAIADPVEDGVRVRIWHYSTLMLCALVNRSGSVRSDLFLCEGWMSQSDVQGMNQIFRSLRVDITHSSRGYVVRDESWNPVIADRFGISAQIPECAR